MKKFYRSFAFILCLFSAFLLVGCNSNKITMSTYFKSTAISRYNNSNTEYNLTCFTSDKVDLNTIKLHTYLQFSGISNWIYDMNIEYVTFYFYSTKSIEVNQLQFKMTALDGGEKDLTTNSHYVSKILSFNAQKEEPIKLRVNIGHRVTIDTLTLTIELQDENLLNIKDFGWTIFGLQVYGDM